MWPFPHVSGAARRSVPELSWQVGMSQSFGIVEEKLHESEFFLTRLGESRRVDYSERGHVLVLPRVHNDEATTLVDALGASELYFTSLVALVFECYEQFRCVVDPQWHFTRENFATNGRTFEDAVSELGFPAGWASSALRAVAEDEAWRILRADQPACGINDLFRKYVGRVIASPDQTSKMGN